MKDINGITTGYKVKFITEKCRVVVIVRWIRSFFFFFSSYPSLSLLGNCLNCSQFCNDTSIIRAYMTGDSQKVMKRLLVACWTAIVIVDFPIPENRSVRKPRTSYRGCIRVCCFLLVTFVDDRRKAALKSQVLCSIRGRGSEEQLEF